MTADEPMSTPDSEGLRGAVAALHIRVSHPTIRSTPVCSTCWAGDGFAEWPCPTMQALAAHPEPVPTPDSADDIKPTVDLRATDRILIDGGNPSLAEAIREQNCTCGSGPEPAELHDDPCPYWDGTYPDETPCSSPLDDDEQRNVKSQVDLHLCPDCGHQYANGRCWGDKAKGVSPVLCQCDGPCHYDFFTPSATPPAVDANRAPVSGGLDEGEREALVAVVHRAFHEAWNPGKPLNLYADSPIWQAIATAVETRVVERLAAVERERDEWERIAGDRLRQGFSTAQECDRQRTRAEAAEAERDTARREAGERIAVAIEALSAERWLGNHVALIDRDDAAEIARADALTSDDGSGA